VFSFLLVVSAFWLKFEQAKVAQNQRKRETKFKKNNDFRFIERLYTSVLFGVDFI
jgi:hypothetical protein